METNVFLLQGRRAAVTNIQNYLDDITLENDKLTADLSEKTVRELLQSSVCLLVNETEIQ